MNPDDDGDGRPKLYYFGEHWGAPRLDGAVRLNAPVNAVCLRCDEVISATDRGLYVADAHRPDGQGAIHAECEVVGILGHNYGVCRCNGYLTQTRTAALELWRRMRMPGWERIEPTPPNGR